jgi:hypothetical protein
LRASRKYVATTVTPLDCDRCDSGRVDPMSAEIDEAGVDFVVEMDRRDPAA